MRKIFTCITILLALSVQGQNFWHAPVGNQRLADDRWNGVETTRLGLDYEGLTDALRISGKASRSLEIPMPNGTFRAFKLKEASILAPALQAKFPNIRTYKGSNERGEIIRIDLTSKGFHGIVFTREGTIFLDPEVAGSSNYVSYYRHDYKNNNEAPLFEEAPIEKPATPLRKVQRKSSSEKSLYERSHGTELRSYRIAIAADNTYTEFHGGTIAGALEAIVTTMNRVTGIYENELAITFVIVDNNDEIIYPNQSTDPFDGLSTSETLEENQDLLDQVIGSANYDIGHVFTTGSGGLAGLGVVCNNSFKARGTTGINSPVGDPFDVDFVAHEIGHQFGGNHTFNGSVGSCSGGNRNTSTAYEPGSGSTIMAYAGICNAHNIQNNSDPYFHAASIDEMLTYATESTGNSCPVITESGNTPPVVTAPEGGFTIPIGTPFSLTASGSDADGDEITYAWEQYDLGDAGAPDNPGRTSPLFRSFSPTTSPTRYFPRLQDVLDGTTVTGENFPTNSRELNFRVTVRDNNSAGGGTNDADIQFNATDQAGPFVVTSQNETTTYAGGSAQLVEWDVANTDKAPINLENVQILLSTDGGVTFSEVLSESTANDGAEFVLMPNLDVTDARIMVAAVGNVFFNVGTSSFSIEQNNDPGFSLVVTEVPGISCTNTIEFTVEAIALNNFSDEISLSFTSDNSELSVAASQTTLNPGESITLNIENSGDTGEKAVTLIGRSGDIESESNFAFSFLTIPSESPASVSPSNEATGIDLDVDFSWAEVTGANSYNFTLATDESFSNVIQESLNQSANSFTLPEDLTSNTTYFWKISAANECGAGPEVTQKFITAFVQEVDLAANDLPVNIIDQSTVTSVISVTQDVTISEVMIDDLSITHSFVSDLTITLTSPAGTTVTLFEQECGSAQDLLVSFDDGADFTTVCPADDGETYQPVGSLSDFAEENALGDWTLSVTDGFAQDQGTINGWNLVLVVDTEAISLFGSSPVFDQVDLVWNDIANDIGYEVEQALGDGEFERVAELATNTSSTSFTGLQSLTEYRYRVRGILEDGFTEYSNIAPVITLPEPPEAPSDLEGTFDSEGRIFLSWSDNSDVEEGFLIERSTDNNSFSELVNVVANITSFRDDNTEIGIDYFYRITAFNVSGSSDPSNVISVIVLSNETLEPSMIYPNPTAESITVSPTLTQAFDALTIYDLKGSILIQASLDPGTPATIDLKHLDPGLYFVQLTDQNDNKQVLKIVKTR